MNRTKEIIQFAQNIKNTYHTRDPFTIAAVWDGADIEVMRKDSTLKDFKAHTVKFPNFPTIISINASFSPAAQTVLCAHELGHALLHNDGINHFATTPKNVFTNIEYEANLFAVALLFDEDDFNIPIEKMSGSTLKMILDYNISGI